MTKSSVSATMAFFKETRKLLKLPYPPEHEYPLFFDAMKGISKQVPYLQPGTQAKTVTADKARDIVAFNRAKAMDEEPSKAQATALRKLVLAKLGFELDFRVDDAHRLESKDCVRVPPFTEHFGVATGKRPIFCHRHSW